jgi:MFS family permease
MTGHRREWALALLGTSLYFSFTYAWNSLAAVITLVTADLGLSSFQTGIVLGTVALTIFFTWPVVGPWVERVGPARAMGLGVVVLGVAGMARATVETFPGLVLAMVVVSLGGSTVTYGLPSVVSSWFSPERSGTPLGVVSVGATLGTVLSFDTMPAVVDAVGGWRLALVVSGTPAVLTGLLWLLVGGVGPHRDEGDDYPSLGEMGQLLRRSDVFTVVLAGALYLFATHSIYGWLSPLLIARGIATGGATQLVAVVTSGMILGALGVPYLADRTGRQAVFVGGGGVAFGACVAGLAVLTPQFWSLAGVALATGVAIGGISPLLRKLPLGMVSSGSVSTVLGMVFGLGALGGFLGPVIIGAARAWTGTDAVGFAVLALPGLAFVGIAFRLRRA